MKKILAIAITVMMLLTMAVVMPVSAANLTTVGPNLVANGSFEIDAVDKSTEIAGWDHVNPDNKMYLWNTVGSGYNPPSDGSFVVYVAKNGGAAGLKQTITLDETADWYTSQDKYAFDLVADMYGGNGNTYIKATVYNADRTKTATQTFNHAYNETAYNNLGTGYYPLVQNKMNYDITVGFTGLIASLGETVRYIELEIGTSNEGSWDNIRLIPKLNLVTNGSFEADQGNTYAGGAAHAAASITGWTRTSGTPYYRVVNRYQHYLVPNDGFNLIQAEAGVDTIMQEITLDEDADYYVNQDTYNYELSFWYYHNAQINITAYSADRSKNSAMTLMPCTKGMGGTAIYCMQRAAINLDEIIEAVGKAKYIVIELTSPAKQSGWDNFVLTPVKSTEVKVPNLIKNGSFEEDKALANADKAADADRDYEIDGWTQINSDVKMYSWATAPTSVFNPPTHGTNVVYVTGAGIKGIYQTINFTDDSEYYRNQSDYNFVLSFDTYAGGTCSRTAVITLTTAEGATVTGTFDHTFKASDLVAARMYRNTFDFTELFSSLALPAKSITVRMETTGELCFDNVKLSPYPAEVSTGENNMLINASFENVVDGNLDSWTVVDYDYELASLCTSEEKVIPDGSNAIKLTNIQGVMVNDAPKSYGGMVKQNVTLEKGKYYQLKYKYVAAAAGSALITISNTSGWAKLLEETAPATSVWTFGKKWIKAEEDMVAEIAMRCHPDLEGAAVYYDDITLIEAVDPDTDNLVFNGSFEVDSNGDTIITGWKQMHASDLYAIKNSAQMGAAADGKYMIQHGTGSVATDAVLAQTVEINNYDYENMKNYDYELGFSIGYLWGGYPTVYVDYYFEDDANNFTNRIIMRRSQAEMDQFTAAPEQLNDVYYLLAPSQSAHVTFNLGDYYGDITSPLKSIRIRLDVQNWGAAYDNVTLRCLDNINTVEIIDANGNAIDSITTNAAAAYTAKATYYGADAGAMSYIAVYTKDANGVLRLAKVANATLTSGVANTNATLSGVNAVAGTTVVKAFILGTEINPVISTIAD